MAVPIDRDETAIPQHRRSQNRQGKSFQVFASVGLAKKQSPVRQADQDAFARRGESGHRDQRTFPFVCLFQSL